MPPSQVEPYRLFLSRIGRRLGRDDISRIGFALELQGDMPSDAAALFLAMEQRAAPAHFGGGAPMLSETNLVVLEEVLRVIERHDLANEVQEYAAARRDAAPESDNTREEASEERASEVAASVPDPYRNAAVERLRGLVQSRSLVVVAGAGVSANAAGAGGPWSSWREFLNSGITYTQEHCGGLPGGWAEGLQSRLARGKVDDFLGVAADIRSTLVHVRGGVGAWLRSAVGYVKVRDKSVPLALHDLKLPIMTTNYDTILERAMPDYEKITLRRIDADTLRSFLGGGLHNTVLHLHGSWDDAESVVLDMAGYNEVSERMQAALPAARGLLFVGSDHGIDDPSFRTFLCNASRTGTQCPVFVLVRGRERAKEVQSHYSSLQIFVEAISYGEDFSELAPFLRSLAPQN